MFENLSERLERSFKILKGEGRITEVNVAETLKDVRKALLDADVNYKVAKTFTDTVKNKAIGQNVLTSIRPSQLMIKIVHDELTTLMGGQTADINYEGHPAVILMSGLQGSGKTTFSSKLANFLKKKKNRNPLLVACDVYRPAAIDQLKVLGEQIEVPVYSEPENKNPVEIALNAIKEAKHKGYNLVIIDTAGRLAIDEAMMQEIAAIKEAVNPTETLFVVDSMTGQDAVNTAKEFNDRLDFTGVILTKLEVTHAAVLRSLSAPLSTSPSSSSVQARRWRPSTSSTPTVWPTAYSVWAMLYHSWSAHKSSSTRKRPRNCNASSHATSSTSTISWGRLNR